MSTFIALLRGINVSGQKKIKMADLREHLAGLGYQNLNTYIQSGNIVFAAEGKSQDQLETEIADCIRDAYGWEVPVVVRDLETWEEVASHNPFLGDGGEVDVKHLYVVFLAGPLGKEALEVLEGISAPPEEFVRRGQVIYLHLPHGAGRAVFNNNFWERQLKVRATSRNWKTTLKLLEMARSV